VEKGGSGLRTRKSEFNELRIRIRSWKERSWNAGL